MWAEEQKDRRHGDQLAVALVHVTGEVELHKGGVTGGIVTSAQTSDSITSLPRGSTLTSSSS